MAKAPEHIKLLVTLINNCDLLTRKYTSVFIHVNSECTQVLQWLPGAVIPVRRMPCTFGAAGWAPGCSASGCAAGAPSEPPSHLCFLIRLNPFCSNKRNECTEQMLNPAQNVPCEGGGCTGTESRPRALGVSAFPNGTGRNGTKLAVFRVLQNSLVPGGHPLLSRSRLDGRLFHAAGEDGGRGEGAAHPGEPRVTPDCEPSLVLSAVTSRCAGSSLGRDVPGCGSWHGRRWR